MHWPKVKNSSHCRFCSYTHIIVTRMWTKRLQVTHLMRCSGTVQLAAAACSLDVLQIWGRYTLCLLLLLYCNCLASNTCIVTNLPLIQGGSLARFFRTLLPSCSVWLWTSGCYWIAGAPQTKLFIVTNLPLGQGMFFRDTLVSLGVLWTTITVPLVLSHVLAFYRDKQDF